MITRTKNVVAAWPNGVVTVLFTTMLQAGCESTAETAHVSGVVTMGDVPLGEVYVCFMPDPEMGTQGVVSSGITDQQGRYQLQHGPGAGEAIAGATLGWHKVIIEDLAAENHRGERPPPQPRIPPRYMDATRTPLEFEILAGTQVINIQVDSD